MRKVKLFIATSLDGYIAGKDDEVDWLFADQNYGYDEFYDSVDTVILGRKTFDYSKSVEEIPFRWKRCYVFTRSPKENNDNIQFINENIPDFVKGLKEEESKKDIFLVGGAKIISILHNNDLIDEYIIFIHPIILGEGKLLFNPPLNFKKLILKESQQYSSGLIKLKYIL